MLNRIGMASCVSNEALRSSHNEDKWQRNEMEDMKKAIEYLYEFKDKLSKLHPLACEAIDQMLQRPRY